MAWKQRRRRVVSVRVNAPVAGSWTPRAGSSPRSGSSARPSGPSLPRRRSISPPSSSYFGMKDALFREAVHWDIPTDDPRQTVENYLRAMLGAWAADPDSPMAVLLRASMTSEEAADLLRGHITAQAVEPGRSHRAQPRRPSQGRPARRDDDGCRRSALHAAKAGPCRRRHGRHPPDPGAGVPRPHRARGLRLLGDRRRLGRACGSPTRWAAVVTHPAGS
jgi:hypothetical protein